MTLSSPDTEGTHFQVRILESHFSFTHWLIGLIQLIHKYILDMEAIMGERKVSAWLSTEIIKELS